MLLFSIMAFAQKNIPPPHCGSDILINELIKINPEIKNRLELMDENLRDFNSSNSINRLPGVPTITIPVAVIIVHNNEALTIGTNISDNQVNDQLVALNSCFNIYGINFCLATKYGQTGLSTQPASNGISNIPGISHVSNTTLTNHNALTDQQALVNTANLATNFWGKYLRIWVVKSINGLGNGVLGYSMFPNTSEIFDGVVVRYDVFGNGTSNLLSGYNQGKTLVHEIGHYLGLYHTFEGGCAGINLATCNSNGDKVCDTPPVAVANFSCNSGTDSCPDFWNLPDSINNYMDYGNDSCATEFTDGQVFRMFNILSTNRVDLFSNDNLILTGICDYQNLLSASFTPTINLVPTYSICTTSTVTFNPVTTVNVTSYFWEFGDGTTSSLQNPIKTYTSAVNSPFTVTLTITRGTDVVISTEKIFVSNCAPILSTDGAWYASEYNLLNFNSGVPVCSLLPSANYAGEAVAMQCNSNGNLLFYSNGVKIYNNLNVALNAIDLLGNRSARDGVVIVPNPSNSSQYYVFTKDSVLATNNIGGQGGFRYSIINVSGTTATLTATLNQAITFPSGYSTGTNGAITGGEGIAVAQHCSGYWIVTTGTKNSLEYLMVYNLNSSGLNFVSELALPVPIVGINENQYNSSMKFSPNGNKLLFNRYIYAQHYLYDFNKFTGSFYNSPINITLASQAKAYGVAFSPNSQLLYFKSSDKTYQLNINSTNISNSAWVVSNNTSSIGQIQMGPDGKLYGATISSNVLSMINNPNNLNTNDNLNACNYTSKGVGLSTVSSWGLPNIINAKLATAFPTTASISFYPLSCTNYRFFPNACGTSFNWEIKNSGSTVIFTTSTTIPTFNFPANGTYTITLRNSLNSIIATTTIVIGFTTPVIVGSSSICPIGSGTRSTNNSVVLLPGQTGIWSISPPSAGVISGLNNQSNVTVNWITAGTLTLTVTSASGCVGTVSKIITELALPTPTIGGSSSACTTTGSNVTTNTTTIHAGYTALWTIVGGAGTITGATTNTATTTWSSLPGYLNLTLTSANGCAVSTTKTIIDQCACNCLATMYFTSTFVTSGIATFNVLNSNPSCNILSLKKYLWSFGDGTSLNNYNNPLSHVYTSFGTFVVTMTPSLIGIYDEGLCIGTPITNTVQVNPRSRFAYSAEEITIFPNPTSSQLNINLNLEKKGLVKVKVSSIDGKGLVAQTTLMENGQHTLKVELPNNISDGLVLVEIISDEIKVTRKILIKK